MASSNRILYTLCALLLAFLLTPPDAEAQRYKNREKDNEEQEEVPLDTSKWSKIRERLVFGGGLGLAAGSGGSYIEISPLVGYRIKPEWQAGIGGTYIYASGTAFYIDQFGNLVGSYRYRTSMYGGRVYSQYDFTRSLFAHGEYEALNVAYRDYYTDEERRVWIGNPFVGGGFRSSLGGRSSINLLFLYNLNWQNNQHYSPYPMPFVIRASFSL